MILLQLFIIIVMEYFQLLLLFWIPLEENSVDILHKIGLIPQFNPVIIELQVLSFLIYQKKYDLVDQSNTQASCH